MADWEGRRLIYNFMKYNDKICGEVVTCDGGTECNPGTQRPLKDLLKAFCEFDTCADPPRTGCESPVTPVVNPNALANVVSLQAQLENWVAVIEELKKINQRIDDQVASMSQKDAEELVAWVKEQIKAGDS